MTITLAKDLPDLSQLPQTFAISLTEFGAITLKGEDKTKYLQGQVTCDVNATNEQSITCGAHCDAKGKTFSVFRLITKQDAHLLLQPTSSIEASLAELKKFGVFAKVEITAETRLSYCALIGDEAQAFLSKKFGLLPDSLTPVIHVNSTSIVYLSGHVNRYLLIDDTPHIEALLAEFNFPIYPQAVWDLLEIHEGFPLLSGASISAYVPQMMNLQAIHGISFTKGCYLGQETVARMQYLGKNKRALFNLNSSNKLDNTPSIAAGDIIELQLGENWRKAGDILASYQANNGNLYIQAVLASDSNEQTALRLKTQPECKLSLVPLPYSLT